MAEKIGLPMLLDNIKGFCLFSGVGTPSILAGRNITAITDLGTGRYEFTFAQPITEFTVIGGCGATSGYSNSAHVAKEESGERTPVSCRIRTTTTGSSSTTAIDLDFNSLLVVGSN